MNPLDQLADINTPNQVSIWPLAWGYWLVMILAIIIVTLLVVSIVKHLKLHRQKKAALAFLEQVPFDDPQYSQQVQNCLKQVCAHYFTSIPTQKVAMMHGRQWHAFVKSKYKGTKLSELQQALDLLDANLYAAPKAISSEQLSTNNRLIGSAIKDWIVQSLPAKETDKQNANRRLNSESAEETAHV